MKKTLLLTALAGAIQLTASAVPYLDVLVKEYEYGQTVTLSPIDSSGYIGDFAIDGILTGQGDLPITYFYNNLSDTPSIRDTVGDHVATFTAIAQGLDFSLSTTYTITHQPLLVDIPTYGLSYLGNEISETHFSGELPSVPDAGSTAGLLGLGTLGLGFLRRRA